MAETTQPNLFGDTREPEPAASGLFAEVVFDRPLDHAYTYAVRGGLANGLAVGKRVLAPSAGASQTVGYCVGSPTEPPPSRRRCCCVLDEEALFTPRCCS